jgi:hypothetical protein
MDLEHQVHYAIQHRLKRRVLSLESDAAVQDLGEMRPLPRRQDVTFSTGQVGEPEVAREGTPEKHAQPRLSPPPGPP